MAKKPARIIEKERARKASAAGTVWLSGCMRCVTRWPIPRARSCASSSPATPPTGLAEAIAAAGLAPEIADPRSFPAPLDPDSVHQGAALEVRALDWGRLEDIALAEGAGPPASRPARPGVRPA